MAFAEEAAGVLFHRSGTCWAHGDGIDLIKTHLVLVRIVIVSICMRKGYLIFSSFYFTLELCDQS